MVANGNSPPVASQQEGLLDTRSLLRVCVLRDAERLDSSTRSVTTGIVVASTDGLVLTKASTEVPGS